MLQNKLLQLPKRLFSVTAIVRSKEKEPPNSLPCKVDPRLPDEPALEKFSKIPKFMHPVKRTGKMFEMDFKRTAHIVKKKMGIEDEMSDELKLHEFPSHCDVVIIGSGATGASVAYWLSKCTRHGMKTVVIDPTGGYDDDPLTYLTTGNLCHQHLFPEIIQMSQFGATFFRDFAEKMRVDIDGAPLPDIQFEPYGSLMLADKDSADLLYYNSDMQNQLGSRNILLSSKMLEEQFPWLNCENIAVGSLSMEREGRFDPTALVNGLKVKGVNYGGLEIVEGRAVGFEFQVNRHIIAPSADGIYEQLERVIVELPNGEVKGIKFGSCVLCAGWNSGHLGKRARMGMGEALLAIDLPIEPIERSIHYFTCPNGPSLDMPYTVDSGIFVQRVGFGNNYVAGILNDSLKSKDFESDIRPHLVNRIPAFKNAKLLETRTGVYEHNYIDENGVIGSHPFYHNIIFATGFCSHSVQFAPAIGRAVSELLLHGEFKTINLSRFNFERFCLDEPLLKLSRINYIENTHLNRIE